MESQLLTPDSKDFMEFSQSSRKKRNRATLAQIEELEEKLTSKSEENKRLKREKEELEVRFEELEKSSATEKQKMEELLAKEKEDRTFGFIKFDPSPANIKELLRDFWDKFLSAQSDPNKFYKPCLNSVFIPDTPTPEGLNFLPAFIREQGSQKSFEYVLGLLKKKYREPNTCKVLIMGPEGNETEALFGRLYQLETVDGEKKYQLYNSKLTVQTFSSKHSVPLKDSSILDCSKGSSFALRVEFTDGSFETINFKDENTKDHWEQRLICASRRSQVMYFREKHLDCNLNVWAFTSFQDSQLCNQFSYLFSNSVIVLLVNSETIASLGNWLKSIGEKLTERTGVEIIVLTTNELQDRAAAFITHSRIKVKLSQIDLNSPSSIKELQNQIGKLIGNITPKITFPPIFEVIREMLLEFQSKEPQSLKQKDIRDFIRNKLDIETNLIERAVRKFSELGDYPFLIHSSFADSSSPHSRSQPSSRH